MHYDVTYSVRVKAETPEEAAGEAARLSLTTRPKDFMVTAAGVSTTGNAPVVVVRVDHRGDAKRVA